MKPGIKKCYAWKMRIRMFCLYIVPSGTEGENKREKEKGKASPFSYTQTDISYTVFAL